MTNDDSQLLRLILNRLGQLEDIVAGLTSAAETGDDEPGPDPYDLYGCETGHAHLFMESPDGTWWRCCYCDAERRRQA